MSKIRTKALIFTFTLPIVMVLVAVIVFGLSQFVAYFQQGADPASIFRGNDLRLPDDTQAMWVSTIPQRGLSPSRGQQEELIAHYWSAWQAYSRAYMTQDTSDLSTYWALPALDQIRQAIQPDVELSTTQHQLTLLFYSDDRSVAQLHDQFLLISDAQRLSATAHTTLTLDNGRWRVRQIRLQYQLPR